MKFSSFSKLLSPLGSAATAAVFMTTMATMATPGLAQNAAASWPNKTVKFIIPFPPGGTLDTTGRMLAQKLSEQLGQTFMVENRPGGNGIIGGDAVAKAPADGYTFLFNASAFVTAPMP
jgi:tripartite-type tricarboxylate transporter receptor subunit TctC